MAVMLCYKNILFIVYYTAPNIQLAYLSEHFFAFPQSIV